MCVLHRDVAVLNQACATCERKQALCVGIIRAVQSIVVIVQHIGCSMHEHGKHQGGQRRPDIGAMPTHSGNHRAQDTSHGRDDQETRPRHLHQRAPRQLGRCAVSLGLWQLTRHQEDRLFMDHIVARCVLDVEVDLV